MRARVAALLQQAETIGHGALAETEQEQSALIAELRQRRPEDVEGRLRVIGLQSQPGADGMRCQECEHFELDQKVCKLPDIALPVNPDWWCRLWRI